MGGKPNEKMMRKQAMRQRGSCETIVKERDNYLNKNADESMQYVTAMNVGYESQSTCVKKKH